MINAKYESGSSKGIFAVLRAIDHKYFSRYSILANLANGTINNLVNYHENGVSMQYTTNKEPYIYVNLSEPMIIRGYMIVNAFYSVVRTYPTAWKITGRYKNEEEFPVDSKSGIAFCTGTRCDDGYIKTYKLNTPKKVTSLTIKGISNSENKPYFILSSFDLFGVMFNDRTYQFINRKKQDVVIIEALVALLTKYER